MTFDNDFFLKARLQFPPQYSTVLCRHPDRQLVVWSCRARRTVAGAAGAGVRAVCVATPVSSVGVATPAPAVTSQGGAGARGLCCIFLFPHLPAIDCRLNIAGGQLLRSLVSRLRRYYRRTSRLLRSKTDLIINCCLKFSSKSRGILIETIRKWSCKFRLLYTICRSYDAFVL